jgi:hypothetical protein
MFDDPFYSNQYSSLSQKQTQQVICSHDGKDFTCVKPPEWPWPSQLACVLCAELFENMNHRPSLGLGKGRMPVNSIDLKSLNQIEWLAFLISY